MNQFTERKKALLSKTSLTEDTVEAINIINDAKAAIDSNDNIVIDDDIINNERAVVRITKNDEQVLAVWYGDNALGLDFNPEDEDSEVIEITGKDADAVEEAMESLIEVAKNPKKDDNPLKDLLEALNEVFSDRDDETDKVLIKVVNTVEGLEGPKYNNLHACWHGNILMVCDGKERVLVIGKTPSGFRVTTTPNKGPASLVVPSGKTAELVEKVYNLVQSKVKNDFAGREDILDGITSILSSLPDGLQRSLMKDLLDKIK